MSKSTRFTYTVVGYATNQWFAIATDLRRHDAIHLVRAWVYGAVGSAFSHPDTAARERQPWWVNRARPQTNLPQSTEEYWNLSPWIVSVIRHVDSRFESQVDDPKRIAETWMVGPDWHLDLEEDRVMYGWCGLKLRPEYPGKPMDTWDCMRLDHKVYSTAMVRQENVGSSPLFRKPFVADWELPPYDRKLNDVIQGVGHVQRRLR